MSSVFYGSELHRIELMKQELKFYIQNIWLLFLIGSLSWGRLQAQTDADSLHVVGTHLQHAFDVFDQIDDSTSVANEGFSFEDGLPQYEMADTLTTFDEDELAARYASQILEEEWVDSYFESFNPTPAKAVWFAALFPGGGQIYNRKYWKLPIVYGGFLGLLYGYNWNQNYYRTYQNAYRDIVSGSPNASYLQFMPGYTTEQKMEFANRQKNYLVKTFQRKKDTYRNWRDYCVVGMLGVYLVSIVDAYVDAALYHFDVTPDLDAFNNPTLMLSYKIDF